MDRHDRSRALFTIDPSKKEQGYEFLNLNSIQKCTLSGGGLVRDARQRDPAEVLNPAPQLRPLAGRGIQPHRRIRVARGSFRGICFAI